MQSTTTTKRIGARELKMRLGTYLREVQEGTTIVVTEHGRPVAELRPYTPAESLEARLDELAAQGVVTLGSSGPLAPFEPLAAAGSLSDAILEEREDRL
jgi:prevent-host-death family protein